jgi:peroxiredoxin family protein
MFQFKNNLLPQAFENSWFTNAEGLNSAHVISDVNVHKTNSFLRPNFQFILISKRNVLFYPYITMIEKKIKTNHPKTTSRRKQNKTEGNFELTSCKLKNKLFLLRKKQTIDIQRQKTAFEP